MLQQASFSVRLELNMHENEICEEMSQWHSSDFKQWGWSKEGKIILFQTLTWKKFPSFKNFQKAFNDITQKTKTFPLSLSVYDFVSKFLFFSSIF